MASSSLPLGSGVGSCLTAKLGLCGYGPDILILRAPDPGPLPLIMTILGGVFPRSRPSIDGELLRITFMCGALLGVSKPAVFALTERSKRGATLACSCFGGEDGPRVSANRSCVTFEKLGAGGASPSESLSLTPKLCHTGPAVGKARWRWMASGELRRICGRLGCATTAMMRRTRVPMPSRLCVVVCKASRW